VKKFFSLSFLPLNADLALLILRLSIPLLVVRYHGWGKLTGWQDEPNHLPNLFAVDGVRNEFHTFPNYIGISSELSYVLVTWCETFGCLAIALGLLTRIHSLGMFITLMVAFYFHHHAHLSGRNSGEVAFAYGCCFLALLCAGPGKYSFDRKLGFRS
jgi:uncharacterized membrane protein YphA (DoxX/SURF4 family)